MECRRFRQCGCVDTPGHEDISCSSFSKCFIPDSLLTVFLMPEHECAIRQLSSYKNQKPPKPALPAGDLLSWSRLGGKSQFTISILKPRFRRSIGERLQMTLPAEELPREAPPVRAEKVSPQRMVVRIAPPRALRRRGRAL